MVLPFEKGNIPMNTESNNEVITNPFPPVSLPLSLPPTDPLPSVDTGNNDSPTPPLLPLLPESLLPLLTEPLLPLLPGPLLPVNPLIPANNALLPEFGHTGNNEPGNNNTHPIEPPSNDNRFIPPTINTPPQVVPLLPTSATGNNNDSDEGTPIQRVKEEMAVRTFKLPVSVIQSMERVMAEYNAPLPPDKQLSFHGYGIDVLTNHEAYRASQKAIKSLQIAYEAKAAENEKLVIELTQYRQQVAQLTAALSQQKQYTPPVSNQPIAVPAPATFDAADIDKYNRLAIEYNQVIQRLTERENTLLSYQEFLINVNRIMLELCAEAERLSWTRATYFHWFFQSQIDAILPQ